MQDNSFEISKNSSEQEFIKCLKCGLKSFHPVDIKKKYCANCHIFHEPDPFQEWIKGLDD